ncbi:MAG TPA: PP2C family protein-serine/threonine phosphatase [Acidimicrobiales bacterium]|nr:PP2C family protein-serine/threonine phosphatase [Acidimicrobiales bacterium]
MSDSPGPGRHLADGLLAEALRRAQHAAPDRLLAAIDPACRAAGVRDPVLYLVDHDGATLTPAPSPATGSGHPFPLPVGGSVAGDVFRSQVPAETTGPGGVRLWLPVSESRCRLGVLAVSADELDDERRRWCADLTEVVAQLVRTRQQYSDTFHRLRRRQPMSLAAELQWSILPPLDFRCDEICVAGLVEPAYHVGGDVFDYAFDDGVLHAAIVDSMGHALYSAIVAGLVVGTYRNCRRSGLDLVSTLETIDDAVAEQFGGERFATVGLAELDVGSGACRWVNAGHPLPLVVRDGEVGEVLCPPRLPVGLGGEPAELCEVTLAPGDRLVCFSDGVTEARGPDGSHFGEAQLVDLLASGAGIPAAELVHTVVHGAIEHQSGTQRDDATVLVLERGSGTPA